MKVMSLYNLSNEAWKRRNISDKLTTLAINESEFIVAENKNYVIAPQKIIRCNRLSDLEARLLLELMSLMGERNYAWPGHKYLSFKLGKKSITSIKNALNSLSDKGFINWQIGGGDMGTNHYRVNNLFYNPYLIMSEATFFCVECILGVYRNIISYDDLYGAALEFVNPKKSIKSEDIYNSYINHLFEYPRDRDCPNLYITFCDKLVDYIEEKISYPIDILWDRVFIELFEKKFKAKFPEDTLYKFLEDQELTIRNMFIEEKFGYHISDSKSVNENTEEFSTKLIQSEFDQIQREAEEYASGYGLDKYQRFFAKSNYITQKLLHVL